MVPVNQTFKDGFILLGFYEYLHTQTLLFLMFLTVYLLCLLGNTFLIILIITDSRLHTPMYLLLSNLSVVDICITSLIFPRFLLTFLRMKSISFFECMLQVYLFIGFESTEYLLLTVMSYDRYVAICHPLHYYLILNKKLCALLVATTWIIGMLDPAVVIILLSTLSFCASHEINHIFCDLVPLLQRSCGDTLKVEVTIFMEGILLGFPSFGLTVSSYISIISVIMKITSLEGRRKAFSTCSSHVTVITLLYLSLLCVYFQPSNNILRSTKAVSLLNVMVIPILNPVLYSLRNKEVKIAFQKLLQMRTKQKINSRFL
ncbi:olfactory receptor 1G1-like [Spea bombifrons]|uniref:olfactory receptor 1G1-like n=1 Tax=Spea bombifrons TaxID=233779 RepID=UPI00234A7B2E|nr:olfactory receptor 1G1-like [Spea bombifrons]